MAKISRGTPRIALRLLRRVRDYAQVVQKTNVISLNLIKEALNSLQIDEKGLDSLDRQYLSFLNKNNNIPTGLDSIAAGLGDDSSMLEFVVEPYLIQIGLLTRTPRGRLLTSLGKSTLIRKMITFKEVSLYLINFFFANIFYIASYSLSLREDLFRNALDLVPGKI